MPCRAQQVYDFYSFTIHDFLAVYKKKITILMQYLIIHCKLNYTKGTCMGVSMVAYQ